VGSILKKKNYNPERHKESYTLYIKNKSEVFKVLKQSAKCLRVEQKRKRAKWTLKHYDSVTPRNGKYSEKMLRKKLIFEEKFFEF